MAENHDSSYHQAKASLHPWSISYWLGAVPLFLCVCVLAWFYTMDAPTERSGSKKAEPILLALQRYKEKETSYPSTLDKLIPDYISSIPKPSFRQQYCYFRSLDGKFYLLAFIPRGTSVIGYQWYYYDSESDQWTGEGSGGDYAFPLICE